MLARVALLIGLVSAVPDKADKFNPLKKFKGTSALQNLSLAVQPKKQSGLFAYFVNTESSKSRAECMTHQLNDQGIENGRWEAVVMKECKDWDLVCMNDVVFNHHKDCFKSGADLIHLFQHGSGSSNSSMKNRAMAVLANWCSHKRLFHELSRKATTNYDIQSLGRNFFREKILKVADENTTVKAEKNKNEKVYIVLEDDAVLRPQFAEKIQDFIQNYDGKWDMLQVDTFGSGKDGRGVDGRDKIGDFKGVPVYHPSMTGEYFGLHCLLIKESSVSKINLEMGLMPAVPVDWFPKLLKEVPDTKVLVWNPDIVIQPEMRTSGKDVTLPKYCDDSVLLSTIGGQVKV